jgi:hypothetical protein
MSGDNDVVGGEIEIPITFVINEVSEKDPTSGLRGQLVGSLCRKVGIANTIKNT